MKTVPMIAAHTLKPINVDMKMDLSSLSLKDSNSQSDENVEQSSPTDIQLDTIQDVVIMADKPEFENGNSYFYMADALDEDESITHDIDEETESDFLDPVDMETVVITDAEDTNTRPWDISSSTLGSEEKIWNANNLFRPTDEPSKTDSSLELFQSLSKGDFQSGARELIEKIFEIGTIRLDEKMVDFFKMDETMSIFMSYLSRVPDRKNPYHPPPDGEIDTSVVRERDRDLKATKYSFRVMEILCCNAPTNSSVVHVKLSIIIKSLFDVFSPTSDGNFHHFRQVFESLLPRHPGPILRMIMNGDNEDDGISKPLLFRMLFYLHEYPVTVSLLTVLFGVSNPKEKARRFARLQSMEFLETILSRLDCKVPQIVEACQDFVVRLVDEALKVEQSDILFKSLEGDRTIIDRIVKTISTGEPYQQEAGIAILHALAVRSNIRPPLSAAARNFFLPQKDTTELVNTATGVKKYLLNHLPFISSQLVPNNTQESDEISEEEGGLKLSSYQVPQPFTHHRLALLEIIHDLLSESVTDSSILDDVSPLFWKQLVNWFFQYKYNSLYQTRFYKIFLQLLRANHSPTFKVIFSKSKFIARMIDHYNEQGGHSDLRGYIILICNTIRLTAEGQSPSEYFHNMLKTHAKWKEFQPILLEATEKQSMVYPALTTLDRKPIPHFTPILPTIDASKIQVKTEYNSVGISAQEEIGTDLGSRYSLCLGFSNSQPQSTDSPTVAKALSITALGSPADLSSPLQTQTSSPEHKKKKKKSTKKKKKKTEADPASPVSAPSNPNGPSAEGAKSPPASPVNADRVASIDIEDDDDDESTLDVE